MNSEEIVELTEVVVIALACPLVFLITEVADNIACETDRAKLFDYELEHIKENKQ